MKVPVEPANVEFTSDFVLPSLSGQAKRGGEARRTRSLPTDGRGHPYTADMEYDDAEVEFFKAVDGWKLRTGRRFPTLAEILRIAQSIGYVKGGLTSPGNARAIGDAMAVANRSREGDQFDGDPTIPFDTAALAAQAASMAEHDQSVERINREREASIARLREVTAMCRLRKAVRELGRSETTLTPLGEAMENEGAARSNLYRTARRRSRRSF
jgi:hypothetical protein